MYENINFEMLRNDLMIYFGSATGIFPAAFINVVEVEKASESELIEIALSNNFDLSKYEENNKSL